MTITIEKGVPIPGIKTKPFSYPWDKMDIKDSVMVPCDPKDENRVNSIRTAALSYGRRHKKSFTTRLTTAGLRVWRTK